MSGQEIIFWLFSAEFFKAENVPAESGDLNGGHIAVNDTAGAGSGGDVIGIILGVDSLHIVVVQQDMLRKAQERNDQHEADKKARMKKAPLPANERDW